MGACPERNLIFPENYSVDMIAGMVKAIEVPDEFEEKPRILVFACENDAYPALDMAGQGRQNYDASVRIIPLPAQRDFSNPALTQVTNATQ